MKQISTPTQSSRIIYLDILRILATLAVIALHVYATQYKTAFGNRIWYYALVGNSLVRWAVPMFVMISGALFLRPDFVVSYATILKKYIPRLAIAYIFWLCAYHLCTLAIVPPPIPTPCYHLWFLPLLVGIYLLIPVLKEIANNQKLLQNILIIWFLLYSVGHFFNLDTIPQVGTLFKRTGVIGYSGYFLLGYYLSTLNPSKKQRTIIYALGIIGALFGILANAYISFKNGRGDVSIMDDNLVPHVVAMSAAIFIAIKTYEPKFNNATAKFCTYVRKDLFGIYLSHVIWLMVLNTPTFRNATSQLITLPIITVVVFILSLYTTKLLRQIPLLRKVVE